MAKMSIMGLALSLALACGGSPKAEKVGSVHVAGGMNALTMVPTPGVVAVSNGVVKVTLTLKAPTATNPTLADVSMDLVPDPDGKFAGSFMHRPEGFGRVIVAEAFNAAGVMLFNGGATDVLVRDNGETYVILMLQETNPVKLDVSQPLIQSIKADYGLVVNSRDFVKLFVVATEKGAPKGSVLSYKWTSDNGAFTYTDAAETTFTPPTTIEYTIYSHVTVTITGSQGNQAALTFIVQTNPRLGNVHVTTISFNNAPVATKIHITTPDNQLLNGVDMAATITVDAYDADGEGLISMGFRSSCTGTFDPPMLATGSTVFSGRPIKFTPTEVPLDGVCVLTIGLIDGSFDLNTLGPDWNIDQSKNTFAYNKAYARLNVGTPVLEGPPVVPVPVTTGAVNLGTAGMFTILSKSGITDVPDSSVKGNVGTSPSSGTAMLLTCDEVVGNIYTVDAAGPLSCVKNNNATLLTAAVGDMELAYDNAAGRAAGSTELNSGDLGGLTLVPGVYKWTTTVTIPADVTLNGSATDVWIFQTSKNLTLSSAKKVILTGGALAKNVFWQVAEGATLGTAAHFEGIILSKTLIAVETGATVSGQLLAQTAVTLDRATVTQP